jgi:uncharacterized membrane protein (UPF0127 family)
VANSALHYAPGILGMNRSFVVAALLIVFVGCSGIAPPAKPLPVTTVTIDSDHGPVKFRVEVAGDSQSQEYGLMNRKAMASDAGMLFDFHQSQCEIFWMKDTILSLDIIFIRADGSISSIAANAVPYSTTQIPSTEPVRAVLELNGGRAAALGIVPGQKVHGAIFNTPIPKDAPLLACQ